MANPRQRDPLANTLGSWLETNRGSEPRIRDVVICLGIGDALQPSLIRSVTLESLERSEYQTMNSIIPLAYLPRSPAPSAMATGG